MWRSMIERRSLRLVHFSQSGSQSFQISAVPRGRIPLSTAKSTRRSEALKSATFPVGFSQSNLRLFSSDPTRHWARNRAA